MGWWKYQIPPKILKIPNEPQRHGYKGQGPTGPVGTDQGQDSLVFVQLVKCAFGYLPTLITSLWLLSDVALPQAKADGS